MKLLEGSERLLLRDRQKFFGRGVSALHNALPLEKLLSPLRAWQRGVWGSLLAAIRRLASHCVEKWETGQSSLQTVASQMSNRTKGVPLNRKQVGYTNKFVELFGDRVACKWLRTNGYAPNMDSALVMLQVMHECGLIELYNLDDSRGEEKRSARVKQQFTLSQAMASIGGYIDSSTERLWRWPAEESALRAASVTHRANRLAELMDEQLQIPYLKSHKLNRWLWSHCNGDSWMLRAVQELNMDDILQSSEKQTPWRRCFYTHILRNEIFRRLSLPAEYAARLHVELVEGRSLLVGENDSNSTSRAARLLESAGINHPKTSKESCIGDPVVSLRIGHMPSKRSRPCFRTAHPLWAQHFCFELPLISPGSVGAFTIASTLGLGAKGGRRPNRKYNDGQNQLGREDPQKQEGHTCDLWLETLNASNMEACGETGRVQLETLCPGEVREVWVPLSASKSTKGKRSSKKHGSIRLRLRLSFELLTQAQAAEEAAQHANETKQDETSSGNRDAQLNSLLVGRSKANASALRDQMQLLM
jgi:hypothetical protein